MTNAILLTELLLQLAIRAADYATLIRKARAEGRDVSDEELVELVRHDDEARAELDRAIKVARTHGDGP